MATRIMRPFLSYMVINTNLAAQSSAELLMQSETQLNQSLARLSSGSKITSPADDSAGLAVSTQLTAQMDRNTAATPFRSIKRRMVMGQIK